MTRLPIEDVLPKVKKTLHSCVNAVLVAAPGAGKTTRVPLALLDEPWLAGRRILMLEPRRLAARSAARYMAALLGEQVGETVGYRVRMDTRVGKDTRIEVITEGVLTRLLQADPALEDVGLVIFDEFHERNLHADVGLALCLQSQSILRDDLRVLVMSATLDAGPIASLLGDAPILVSEGKMYPVETRYISKRIDDRIEPAIVRTIGEALKRDVGDILVFLPGAGEIRRVERQLIEEGMDASVYIAPLYGSLPREAQDAAVAPSPKGQRKVVLATSIAETSLTVEGVRVVIDSGLMRVPRFSPRTGMTRLETIRVSRSSADQRQGRAGRQAPGVCYRLWTEEEDRYLAPRSTPEILAADLIPLALELAAWGVANPGDLLFLDFPPAAAFNQARDVLMQLGAVDNEGKITEHGRRMAEAGLHPRLAHMILQALPLGEGRLACDLAALLSERDLFRAERIAQADIRLRIEALYEGKAPLSASFRVDEGVRQRILVEAAHWRSEFGVKLDKTKGFDACGLLLAFAYPDRIASRRETGRFLLRSGRGAALPVLQPLSNEPYIVAAQLDDQGAEGRIYLAAPLDAALLNLHFAEQIVEDTLVFWDREAQSVRARKREMLGALTLKDTAVAEPNPEAILAALLSGIAEEGLGVLPWNKSARQLQQRMIFMHRLKVDWPDVSDTMLAKTVADWLGPHLYGMRSRSDLQCLRMQEVLEALLPWERRRQLDEYAPSHCTVPSGSRIPIDYSNSDAPVLAVKLQELFGWRETPCIGGGRVPLTLHLLSPARRPVQVTQDLASFWANAYFEVKKDLKGRYPKHYWPDNPLEAIPTNRTRPPS
ncbi:ATP-dependent helicase HrpB [Aneurinibacillus sp. REN35]|uniref:ATP-dependent helicase HrpB n=1 Tax=Aneurinibacillus sp. REN35 TaxID=3237286 RepID=UPI0035288FEC